MNDERPLNWDIARSVAAGGWSLIAGDVAKDLVKAVLWLAIVAALVTGAGFLVCLVFLSTAG